jgi:hypothetical protein
MNPSEHREFLRRSFNEYLQTLDEPLEPADSYLAYKFPYIAEAKWQLFAGTMLQDELCEVTNRLHAWRDMLRRWHAWNQVANPKEEMLAWDLHREFLDPLMHSCLLLPSAVRDLFTFVGTNAMHQLRLHVEPGYKDRLEGDPSPLDPKPRPLNRREKEIRLAKLAKPLASATNFVDALRKLDDAAYREKTEDYRNSNSHAIGPRIAVGHTRMVTRTAVPLTRMEVQPDGTVSMIEVPGKYVAGYCIGGQPPLDPEVARLASLKQYDYARNCFEKLTHVIQIHASTLPRADA